MGLTQVGDPLTAHHPRGFQAPENLKGIKKVELMDQFLVEKSAQGFGPALLTHSGPDAFPIFAAMPAGRPYRRRPGLLWRPPSTCMKNWGSGGLRSLTANMGLLPTGLTSGKTHLCDDPTTCASGCKWWGFKVTPDLGRAVVLTEASELPEAWFWGH
jgi:hypothetical protein